MTELLRKQWLHTLENAVNPSDLALLDKASRILTQNIVPAEENPLWAPYRGICPSPYNFPGIWNWDSAFHAVGTARFDRWLAQEQAYAFFSFQKENGMLPDVIFSPKRDNRIEDHFGKPPVWAWAVERMDREYADSVFLRNMYPKLVLNEKFWRTERFNEEDGLFFYSTSETGPKRDLFIRWESGLDNSIRFDDGVIESLYPIDLNCFMVSFYQSMQYLAIRMGKADEAQAYAEKEAALTQKIRERLWSEEDQCFWDYNFRDKEFVRVLTPAAFMPLWVHIATPAQAAALNALAADKTKLFPCMPTVSLDHPKIEPAKGYWRGPVWMNVAYFAIKGLYDYGFRSTSMGIRDTLLSWMKKDDSIHENYNPLTGEPLNTKDFGWSCTFAMEMVLEMR